MRVDENLWYLIAFFGFIGILLTAWAMKHIVRKPRLFFTKHIQYATLLPRVSITRLQALVMLIFLLSNILISIIPILPFPDWLIIQKRAALASVANVTLMCVGGRGLFFNALNISRKWLVLIHVWVGIVATLEAILHSTIAVSLKIKPDNYHMMRSGWIVSLFCHQGVVDGLTTAGFWLNSWSCMSLNPCLPKTIWEPVYLDTQDSRWWCSRSDSLARPRDDISISSHSCHLLMCLLDRHGNFSSRQSALVCTQW